jgi:hypothetical protein
VTSVTDTFGVPCPDGSDYAASALYLQRLAESTEADLLAFDTQLTEFETRPVGIWTNSAAQGPLAFNAVGTFVLDANQVVYRSYSTPTLTPFRTNQAAVFPGVGIYEVGWNVNMIEDGAITADTFRQVAGRVLMQDPTGATVVVADMTRRVLAEGVAGGQWMAGDTTFLLSTSMLNRCWIELDWTHGNTGSTMTIPIGGVVGWIHKIGTVDPLEVV